MPVLSRTASFATAVSAAGLALWASAASTPNYPLYAKEWNLAPWVPAAMFAAYPATLIPVLLVLGNLSDHVGRRRALLAGLSGIAAGAVALGAAPDPAWVFAGRALMGLGVGLTLSPATAAAVEFSGPGREHRAHSVTTAGTATGLVLALLVGGGLVQYGPAPLYADYWALFVVVVVALATVWFLPRGSTGERAGSWRPRRLLVPRQRRSAFLGGVLGIAAAYAIGAVYVGLGAQIGQALLHSSNALVACGAIALSTAAIGVVAILGRRVQPMAKIVVGAVLTLPGMSTLVFAGLSRGLLLFILSGILCGAAYSLLFAGGLALINLAAPVGQHGAALSSGYLVAYAVQAATALGLGAVATASGFQRAVDLALPVVAALALGAVSLAGVGRREPRPARAPGVPTETGEQPLKAAPVRHPASTER
jgi:predicted MFS family arabinose efflux permease